MKPADLFVLKRDDMVHVMPLRAALVDIQKGQLVYPRRCGLKLRGAILRGSSRFYHSSARSLTIFLASFAKLIKITLLIRPVVFRNFFFIFQIPCAFIFSFLNRISRLHRVGKMISATRTVRLAEVLTACGAGA